MGGKYQFWLHLTLIVSLIIGTTTFLSPVAAQFPTLSVLPSSIIDESLTPDSAFSICIHVADVFDLYMLEFKLRFDPDVLNATSVSLLTEESGGLWPVDSQDFWVAANRRINNDIGYVWYCITMPERSDRGIGGGDVGVTGDLAVINFKVVGYGDSLLHPYNTTLQYSPGNPDYPTEPMLHLVQDGYFANQIITHDVAVTDVTASPTSVPVGDSVTINVTVENQGAATETFDVFAYHNATPIGSATVTSLPPGTQETKTFTWDTIDVKDIIGVTPGIFTIWAEAVSPWGPTIETDQADNTFTDGEVTVCPRNIAITDVTASPTTVYKPDPVSINVTVKNEGYFSETFNVTTYYDSTAIGTQTVVALGSLTDRNLTFTWNTKFVATKDYIIKANASPIRGEYNLNDNNRTDSIVTVSLLPGAPTASFVVSPDPPYFVDSTLEFNSTSTDSDGYIVSWQWDFNNDGIIEATDENTTYTYTAVGTYIVTLTVTDNSSLSDWIQESFDILRTTSTISITASPTNIKAGESTTISGSITPKRVGVTVTIKYRLSGQTSLDILTTRITNDNSQYSYDWITENVGLYDVTASWPGDVNTESATSPTAGITVNKMASTISITADPATVTLGSSVTISGAISPIRASATVTIQSKPSDGAWTTLTTKTTDSNGQYSYTWTPTTVQEFTVKAQWEGDSNTEPAESSTTVTVNKMPSTITINVNETSITLGSSVTISGAISPVRASVTVTIQYKPSSGAWTTLTTGTTDSEGKYSYTWAPSAFETFQMKARWTGDASTLQAESDAKTLTVKAPPVASFTYAHSAPKVGDPVTFTSTSTDPDGSIVGWNWDFDDGTSGTGETVTHTYATAGNFTVKLTITDSDGLTDTKSITITVSEAPTGISIYLIAAIGAIIIIAIGIVAYSLIRKRH